MIISDQELLRQFTNERSESALAELVSRHVDLVYATALRILGGDAALAKDVTQLVFIHLAQKADRLPEVTHLPGWLHRHTYFTACATVRSEQRRKSREQIAMHLGTFDNHRMETPWESLAPHLDEALNSLGETDRHAIVLRFLKQQDLRTLGAALGLSEDAAQKRVARALEKLRNLLGKRGVALTTVALASLLTAHSATAAPTGLALAVSSAAALAPGPSAPLTTFLRIMASTKMKTGLATALIVACVTLPISLQQQAQARQQELDTTIHRREQQLAQMRVENKRLAELVEKAHRSRGTTDTHLAEVLKLRSEVNRLMTQVRALAPADASPTDRLEARKQTLAANVIRLKEYLETHPDQSIPELKYLPEEYWLQAADVDFETTLDYARALRIARANAEHQAFFSPMFRALRLYLKANNGGFPTSLSQLAPYLASPIDADILERYEIVPTKELAPELRPGGDWAITQKNWIDEALDLRTAMGSDTIMSLDERTTNRWRKVP